MSDLPSAQAQAHGAQDTPQLEGDAPPPPGLLFGFFSSAGIDFSACFTASEHEVCGLLSTGAIDCGA